MNEIVIISGKGGTGKTSIAAAFSSLAEKKVIADCDVDAADLHLILKPAIQRTEEFVGGKSASIRLEDCTQCGRCIEVCQFDAIQPDFVVDPVSCEGCGVCVWFCPVNAIDFTDTVNGHWYISQTRHGTMVHARLGIAQENSGKLVSIVRQQAKERATGEGVDYIIVDGAPGIGCPVISSISGANAVLVVTEPTISGIHDMERVIRLSSDHFHIHTFVCVNKYDLNPEMTQRIEKYCEQNQIALVGKIPYDTAVTEAMVREKTIIEYNDGFVSEAVKEMWGKIETLLETGPEVIG